MWEKFYQSKLLIKPTLEEKEGKRKVVRLAIEGRAKASIYCGGKEATERL